MDGFAAGEQIWIDRLGSLRNLIRQELLARQLADVLGPGTSVLDVGCGQGTQALRLARRGHAVTCVDPSARLLGQLLAESGNVDPQPSVIQGSIGQLDQLLGEQTFDLVCAHGLLMYLQDRKGSIAALTHYVASGGLLSITFRNGNALAFRPGIRRDWSGANAGFDETYYLNELGLSARADRLEDVLEDLGAVGFEAERWYGVRVFNDGIPGDMPIPADEDLDALLDAEEEAGRRDPYRGCASQIHLIARRR